MNDSSVKLSSLVSVLTTFTIGASIVYESALHWRLAKDTLDLLEPADFLSSPLRWMPQTILFVSLLLAIAAIIGRFFLRPKIRSLFRERLQRKKCGQCLITYRREILVLIPFFSYYLIQPLGYEVFFIGILYFAWTVLARYSYKKAKEPQFLGALTKPLWLYGPILALSIGLYAIWQADVMVNKQGVYSVTIRDGRDVGQATIVRSLWNGLLIFDSREKSLKYFPWDRVQVVTRNIPPEKESLLCRCFGWQWSCKENM